MMRSEQGAMRLGRATLSGAVAASLLAACSGDDGGAIDRVVDVGGSAVRIQRFSLAVDDDARLLDDARSAAFADAQRRAERYAGLAGRELGDLVAISEVIGPLGPGAVPEVAQDASVAAPIEPGQQEAVVLIQTTWALA